jgi:hypothetical protein
MSAARRREGSRRDRSLAGFLVSARRFGAIVLVVVVLFVVAEGHRDPQQSRRRRRRKRNAPDPTGPPVREPIRHAAIALGAVLAIAGVVMAVVTYPSSDLPPWIVAFALCWFVGPLVSAYRRGDGELIATVLDARTESMTLLILKWISWIVVAVIAIAAGFYWLPLSGLAYIAAYGQPAASSDPPMLALLAILVGGVFAGALYPFCAGVCASLDRSDRLRLGPRALRGVARMWRWSGRRVVGPVARVAAHPMRWFLGVSMAGGTLAIIIALYAAQGALANGTTFDPFTEYGLDKDHVAIGAAAGGLFILDVIAELRARCRQVDSAIVLVLGEFAAIGALTIAIGFAIEAQAPAWLLLNGGLAGALFGAWFAILVDLGQAAAAGMTGLGQAPARSALPGACEVVP